MNNETIKPITIIIGIIVILILVIIFKNDYNDALKECIKGGNSETYCKQVLKD